MAQQKVFLDHRASPGDLFAIGDQHHVVGDDGAATGHKLRLHRDQRKKACGKRGRPPLRVPLPVFPGGFRGLTSCLPVIQDDGVSCGGAETTSRSSRIRVISDGAPKRLGGPQ